VNPAQRKLHFVAVFIIFSCALGGAALAADAAPPAASDSATAALENDGDELVLPAAALAEIHPDGARLHHRIDLPAGRHALRLDGTVADDIAVTGAAAWSTRVVARPHARPVLPPALENLLADRNRLQAAARALRVRGAVIDDAIRELAEQVPRLAHAANPDPAAWQASLDALLAAKAKLDADLAADAAERDLLRVRGDALLPTRDPGAADATVLLGLETAAPLVLDAVDVERTWNEQAVPSDEVRLVVVDCPAPATIDVCEIRTDLRWTPAAAIVVAGRDVRLIRRCLITKQESLDFGAPTVVVSTDPLQPDLAIPEPRPVGLHAEPIARGERRIVVSTSLGSDWGEAVRSAAATAVLIPTPAAAAADGSFSRAAVPAPIPVPRSVTAEDSNSTRESLSTGDQLKPQVAAPSAHPATDGPMRLQTWTLGTVRLAAHTATIATDAGTSALTVVGDEWALIPEIAPLAVRHLSVLLDDKPLLAGALSLVVDGKLIATENVHAASPGQMLHLRAGEDDRAYVDTDVAWDIDPAAQTPTHQRIGRDRWIWNLGDRPRTMTVYLTMPVSHSKEVTVTLDPATTPDATTVEPGVLRWTITLAPGAATRLGLGWQLDARDGFHF
jgi:hypothetical protein